MDLHDSFPNFPYVAHLRTHSPIRGLACTDVTDEPQPSGSDPADSASPDSGMLTERHASWAELFFDLVAVAGVAGLAHVLAGEFGPLAPALYVALFLAFWMTWLIFTLYGNSAGSELRLVRLLIGMFGLGVMAAAIPGVTEAVLHHETTDGAWLAANAFALAYVIARWFGAQSWRGGQLVTDFPIAQQTLGILPWVVSLWVDGEAKLALWGLGLAIDVGGLIIINGSRMLASYQRRADEMRRRVDRSAQQGPLPVHHDRRGNRRTALDRLEAMRVGSVRLDPEHLAERLGLFVIIVLGEGIIQMVRTSWEVPWDRGLLGAGLVGFLLLVGLFTLSLLYGHAGIPYLRPGVLGIRVTLALHFVVAGSIAALATALAETIEVAGQPLPTAQRWLMCAAVMIYFGVGLIAAVAGGNRRRRSLVPWVIAGIVLPAIIGATADQTRGTTVAWYVAAVLLWHILAARRRRRGDRTDIPDGVSPPTAEK